VLEPQWPPKSPSAFVKQAHAAKRQVIPWTIDKRSEVIAAANARVDGIITDDLPVARAGLKCFAAEQKLKAARAALKKAKTASAKKKAAARVKAAKKKRDKACA